MSESVASGLFWNLSCLKTACVKYLIMFNLLEWRTVAFTNLSRHIVTFIYQITSHAHLVCTVCTVRWQLHCPQCSLNTGINFFSHVIYLLQMKSNFFSSPALGRKKHLRVFFSVSEPEDSSPHWCNLWKQGEKSLNFHLTVRACVQSYQAC